jgi:hypothetical protein
MKIKKFDKFKRYEAVTSETSQASKISSGGVTLYRLTNNEVDLSNPGSYYVTKKEDINPKFLKNKSNDLYLMTVKCDSGNIDLDKSEVEIAKLDCPSAVVVKDDKKCKLVKMEPYQNQ